MPFPKVTKKDVAEQLQKVGLRRGDIIYVASFVTILGNEPHILDHTIDALIEAVGDEGTVVMPTFNWDYCKGEIFDPVLTPSQVGVLTELFRKRPGVVRSLIPPWCTFAAAGKDAARIAGIKGSSSFGADSVLQYLYDVNARYVLLGCTYGEGAVHVHWLEEKFEVPYRFWKRFSGTIRIDGAACENTSTMYARRIDLDAKIDSRRLTDIFDRTGKVKIAKLGLGEVRSFLTKDYVDFMTPYFQKDRLAILAPESRKNFE